jgi:rubredoxin
MWIYNQDQADICRNCGNVYQVLHLKESDDYNDFGQRYCPFCGAMSQQLPKVKAA